MCVGWKRHGRTAMPAGTTNDPTNNCCTSAPGNGTNFSACPAGTTFQQVSAGVHLVGEPNVVSVCGPIGGVGLAVPANGQVDQQTCPTSKGGGGGGGGGSCPAGETYKC